MNRRSFFRVAVLGAGGVAAVEACPEWLEDLLKPRKTYFLPSLRDLPCPWDGLSVWMDCLYTVDYMGLSRRDL